jgi:hypothetical protein
MAVIFQMVSVAALGRGFCYIAQQTILLAIVQRRHCMAIPRILIISPALILAALLSVGCGGGGAKVEASTTTTTTTMGQELTDLKKAYDQGILTKDQYEEQKSNILRRYNN